MVLVYFTNITYAANNFDPISIMDDLGTETRTYNGSHDVTAVTDRLGHTTAYTYNSYGQVTSVQDALGIITTYTYDAGHRLTAVTRVGQTLHQYTYDGLDRVRTHTDPTGLTKGGPEKPLLPLTSPWPLKGPGMVLVWSSTPIPRPPLPTGGMSGRPKRPALPPLP